METHVEWNVIELVEIIGIAKNQPNPFDTKFKSTCFLQPNSESKSMNENWEKYLNPSEMSVSEEAPKAEGEGGACAEPVRRRRN